MTPKDIRIKRATAGIAGQAVCQVAGISRAKLSEIELGYANPSPEELQRINAAIERIVRTRQDLTRLAKEAGLSLAGVRL